ncbi:hypothetical protein ACLKZ7_10810 [Shewanella algae]|uniref:hypothetical protein n=1 Tax=Shewanella algae TaxID=38313 RepID=UPI002936A6CB|nr:hypothetical protein [Shewanella algae]MDV2961796.1 hypothetical protein [Shewanella algae]
MPKLKKLLPITIPLTLLLSSIIINLLYDYHEIQDIDGMYQMIKEVEGPDKQVKRITFSLYIDIDSESFWGLLQLSDNKEKTDGKILFSGKVSRLVLHDNAVQVEQVKVYPVSADSLEVLFANPALSLLKLLLATDYKVVWHYTLVDQIFCFSNETDTSLRCMKKVI